jgi:type IV secretory pathway VirB2 component (pilin)
MRYYETPARLPSLAGKPALRVSRDANKEFAMHVSSLGLLASNSMNVNVNPTQDNLPGTSILESLAGGIGHWALIASIVGVIVGGVMWAFGHFSHNYQQSYNGRRGLIVSGVAALLIGGATQIISFFFSQGGKI